MTETVKVQRSLATTAGGPMWLIYDKGRKHMTEVPDAAIPRYVKDAMGGDAKAYFEGAWSSIVGWGLSRRVKAEAW